MESHGPKKEMMRPQVSPSKSEDENWVHDSSVDYKGNIPLRASTGSWKAAVFIIGILINHPGIYIYTYIHYTYFLIYDKALHLDVSLSSF
jgi:hypothetical protein